MTRKTYRKIITSEERDERIEKRNKKLSTQFLRDKSRNVSELTVKNYESDLRIFFTWNLLHNENKFFINIERIEFSDFFAYASDTLQWGSSRMNRMRSCLSSFSQFIAKFFYKEYPDFRNVILEIIDSVPKEVRREKTVLLDDDVDRLLLHLSKRSSQMACFVALAVSSGARASELLRFTVSTIDEADLAFDGLFLHTATPIKSKGRGKAGRQDKKYILRDTFIPYFETWKKDRHNILADKDVEHDFLFIKKNGQPATDGTMRGWTKHFSEYLGTSVYPHSFRHRCTTYLRERGIPKDLVQHLLGWKSSDMVDIYDDREVSDMKWEELDNLRE